jgi:hypothetical protein
MSWEIRESRNADHPGELIFQTLDWYNNDVENDETGQPEYKIFVFGVDLEHRPVRLQINGFCPFFFIEIPGSWDSTCIYKMREHLWGTEDVVYLERKRYYGFENNKIRKFLKLSFTSLKSMRSMKYRLENKGIKLPERAEPTFFPIYESNIDPILRFMHIRDILSASWIKVKNVKLIEDIFQCD